MTKLLTITVEIDESNDELLKVCIENENCSTSKEGESTKPRLEDVLVYVSHRLETEALKSTLRTGLQYTSHSAAYNIQRTAMLSRERRRSRIPLNQWPEQLFQVCLLGQRPADTMSVTPVQNGEQFMIAESFHADLHSTMDHPAQGTVLKLMLASLLMKKAKSDWIDSGCTVEDFNQLMSQVFKGFGLLKD